MASPQPALKLRFSRKALAYTGSEGGLYFTFCLLSFIFCLSIYYLLPTSYSSLPAAAAIVLFHHILFVALPTSCFLLIAAGLLPLPLSLLSPVSHFLFHFLHSRAAGLQLRSSLHFALCTSNFPLLLSSSTVAFFENRSFSEGFSEGRLSFYFYLLSFFILSIA
jgi:hypothetical protein